MDEMIDKVVQAVNKLEQESASKEKRCPYCDRFYSNWRVHKRLCISRPRRQPQYNIRGIHM